MAPPASGGEGAFCRGSKGEGLSILQLGPGDRPIRRALPVSPEDFPKFECFSGIISMVHKKKHEWSSPTHPSPLGGGGLG